MRNSLSRIIASVENAPLTLASFIMAFLALIVVRLTVENALLFFERQSLSFMFFEFTHTLFFFLGSFLVLLPVVRFAGADTLKKAASVLLVGFPIILAPPIIDTLIARGNHFWSFYEFDGLIGLIGRFFTLFGDTPDIGITYGVRIEVVIVTLALGLYALIKSRRISKALLAALLTYAILFILGTFPSWLALIILSFQKSFLAINGNDVAALFLTPEAILGNSLADFRSALNFKMSLVYAYLLIPIIGWILYREQRPFLLTILRNVRLPQLCYHTGLALLGIFAASTFAGQPVELSFFNIFAILLLTAATNLAWLASVVVNDRFDTKIDTIANPTRPLVAQTLSPHLYDVTGIIFFSFSLLFGGILGFKIFLLLLAYQAIAWIYSAPPFRLKRLPVVGTFLAGCASVLIFLAGFTLLDGQDISAIPNAFTAFLLAAYTFALPLKDFKDIDGDRADHIWTFPVLLGEKRGKSFVGSTLFLLFITSVFLIQERSLFLPAIICGTLSFFLVQRSAQNHPVLSYRRLMGWEMAIVALYTVCIAFLVS